MVNPSAFAAASIGPKQIVDILYKPYLADPHAETPNSTPGALDAIYAYASSNLRQAIDKDRACEQREQGICNIDSDAIINGQDWDLSNLVLQEDAHKDNNPVIRAEFLSGGKNRVSYFFIQENGRWKIDEVDAVRFKENGKIDSHFKLKETLLR